MNFQLPSNALSSPPRRNINDAVKVTRYSIVRDGFKLTTWLALGASIQSIISFLLPPVCAAAPVTILLTYRFLRTVLSHNGLINHKQMDGVLLEKHCVPASNTEVNPFAQPSGQQVAVLILAARSNHALGIFGPGYRDVSSYINDMVEDLWENAVAHGFLGQTTWLAANERHTNNQVMVICYFQSMEQLHRYAHGSLHRQAWRWWNKITATHPHLSIMHEMYHAQENNWENIFINNHMTGIASMQAMPSLDGGNRLPLVDASRGRMQTQMGRLGCGDGKENENYGLSPYSPLH